MNRLRVPKERTQNIGMSLLPLVFLIAGAYAVFVIGRGNGYEKGRWDCEQKQTQILKRLERRMANIETRLRMGR